MSAVQESSVAAIDARSSAVRAFEDFYRGIAALEADPSTTLDQLRDGFAHWGDVARDPPGVDYVHADAGGVPALRAVPPGYRTCSGSTDGCWRRGLRPATSP